MYKFKIYLHIKCLNLKKSVFLHNYLDMILIFVQLCPDAVSPDSSAVCHSYSFSPQACILIMGVIDTMSKYWELILWNRFIDSLLRITKCWIKYCFMILLFLIWYTAILLSQTFFPNSDWCEGDSEGVEGAYLLLIPPSPLLGRKMFNTKTSQISPRLYFIHLVRNV